MKLPNWLKIVWWLILVIISVIFVAQRFDTIMNGTSGVLDIIVLLVLIALLTIPLFQEVSFFGVGLKREIDNLKTEFKEQVINLRSEIQNTINVRTEINYPSPPPDSELPEIRRISETTLKEQLKKLGMETQPVPEATVPEDISYLFEIRYNIESELNRITKLCWLTEDTKYYPKTIVQMLEFLTKMNIIHRNLAFIIKEIVAWCSAAIHGEQISKQAMQWIRQDAPGIIEALKAIPEEAEATKVQR